MICEEETSEGTQQSLLESQKYSALRSFSKIHDVSEAEAKIDTIAPKFARL